MVDAVEGYLLDKGSLPNGDAESGTGGYDTTLDATFMSVLLTNNCLREPVRDPINNATDHYEHQHYATGTSGYTNVRGYWKGTNHDWTNDFAYCTGGVSR